MDEAFEKLKKEGKTDVESLIKWLKDSMLLAKIIEDAKAAEEKARALFTDCANKQAVELDKFKEAVGKIADEQKKNVEDFTKTLAEQGPKLLSALQAGASAFKDAMTKK
ncbi:uncharacterized protein LOC135085746 isoform X1 [Ostrinia nubilalis]|uniref:uncharacterized protein LOC114349545 isoform X1 n=1 Tax=Ostrinia furnacalis TaxID=93504 RepID=UPI001039411A|nr:uncharacterized protein LOC114349545 isoform X1 [Ostrinia furnacalis]